MLAFYLDVDLHGKNRSWANIGLAHEFQQVAELPIESWDIPIVTSKGIIKCWDTEK